MYFAYVIFVVVTMFIFVQCHHGHHSKKHNDYTVTEETDCGVHRMAIINATKNTNCQPYERHVALRPMPFQKFRPSVVSVKQCDGNCPGNVCMPTEKRTIKVPVKSDNMCALVEVEEHLRCKCMCLQKEQDCTDKQYYDKSHCFCECKNRETEKHKCEKKIGMVWNDNDCSCNCTKMNIGCTTGLNWNRDICACS